MNIKLFIAIVLVLSVGAFYILPRTRLAGMMKMNETLFQVVNITGTVCGATGLFFSLALGEKIMTGHYFEIILLPAVLLYLYSAVVIKARGGESIYDEKQNHDMTRGAALTLPFSIGGMFILFGLYREGLTGGMIWFPVYLFLTLTVYSAGTLVYFRRS
jgi:hypothetical protein